MNAGNVRIYIWYKERTMPKFINATQAARILGVTDKTVRTWIKRGDIHAEHVTKNRLAILKSDVEKLKRKREYYQSEDKEDVSLLVEKIEELTEKCSDLERKYSEIELKYRELSLLIEEMSRKKHVVEEYPVVNHVQVLSHEKDDKKVNDDIPHDCVWARDFAVKHGVKESSFRRHMTSGIGGDMVEAEKCAKGRYLTHEQQEKAIIFWKRHNVKFGMPDQ
jgi:superfamily II RNA helicase